MRDFRISVSALSNQPREALLGNPLSVDGWVEAGGAPRALTGCLSELSSCQAQDHVYLEALKSYAEVYAAYQDYLMPDDPVARHDYSLKVSETEEHSQLGLLIEDFRTESVSDDEIDDCGYLGWLRH